MGHRKKHAPKHGSLAYSPRKRAKRLLARVRYWPEIEADTPRLLGFIGYKAGMTHVFAIEDRKRSPNYGNEVIRPATVLETPPMLICAVRAYTKTPYGFRAFTEAWMEDPPDELEVFKILQIFYKGNLIQILGLSISQILSLLSISFILKPIYHQRKKT